MAADDDEHDDGDRHGRAWVLNLDADLELAAGLGYAPKRSVREAMSTFVGALAGSLLDARDVLVDPSSPEAAAALAKNRKGRCFCPTPSALAALIRAGARPEPHPSFDVLRRVNGRAFSASLGQTLAGGTFARDFEHALATINERPPLGADWRAKRAFGMSGRGQRIVRPGAPSAADLGFLRACVAEGGLQIEPNVPIESEYAIHGIVAADGAVRLGSLVTQRCDAVGAWLSTTRIHDAALERTLAAEAEHVAGALHREGYFGPFGIDAFTFRGPGGLTLQPRSEVNARYTMGFAIGLGTN